MYSSSRAVRACVLLAALPLCFASLARAQTVAAGSRSKSSSGARRPRSSSSAASRWARRASTGCPRWTRSSASLRPPITPSSATTTGRTATRRNALAPTQPTTLVLGDGDPTNGDARNFTTDPRVTSDVIFRGTYLNFSSDQAATFVGPTRASHPRPAARRLRRALRRRRPDRLERRADHRHPRGEAARDAAHRGLAEVISKQAVFAALAPIRSRSARTRSSAMAAQPPASTSSTSRSIAAYEDGTHVYIDNQNGQTVSTPAQPRPALLVARDHRRGGSTSHHHPAKGRDRDRQAARRRVCARAGSGATRCASTASSPISSTRTTSPPRPLETIRSSRPTPTSPRGRCSSSSSTPTRFPSRSPGATRPAPAPSTSRPTRQSTTRTRRR